MTAAELPPPIPPPDALSFEQALAKLEEIVHTLEDGQLGLSQSLASYEEAVKCLKQCQEALQCAERKIVILTGTDADGNPVAEPFDDQALSLEEKQQRRRERRTSKGRSSSETPNPGTKGDADIDNQRGLF